MSQLKQRVQALLAETPGGDLLDSYFGISREAAAQPNDEAHRSDQVLEDLEIAETQADIDAVLEEIADIAKGSGVDSDALRALRSRRNALNFVH